MCAAKILSALFAGLLISGAAFAEGKERAREPGYLAPGSFDILRVLPPAPQKDDARYEADRAIFKATRKLEGTPRWSLATSDVKTGLPEMMQDFSCALGVPLTPQNAPLTAALIKKAGRDTGDSTGVAKRFYKRLRPFQIDSGKTCQAPEELAGSYDYPSGHTTWGWTWAEILAELAPDKADAILARGRAYGQSRIVCGVHNATAVDAGYMSASATLAAVRNTPAFKEDFAAAKHELDILRAKSPAPQSCQAETNLIAQDILHVTP